LKRKNPHLKLAPFVIFDLITKNSNILIDK